MFIIHINTVWKGVDILLYAAFCRDEVKGAFKCAELN